MIWTAVSCRDASLIEDNKEQDVNPERESRPEGTQKLLSRLLEGVRVASHQGDLNRIIRGISADSRTVNRGDLFIALPGQHMDGHRFVEEAFLRGAAAVIVERVGNWGDCWVLTPDSLEAMAGIAANYYEHPADGMRLVAITGSNGKTTCSYLIESMLLKVGRRAGLLSTIEYRCPGWSHPASATTPLSIDLHRYFAQMKQAGTTHVVMEVSSHALVLRRVLGLEFSTALFTNLTQDHLDFHQTMESYGEAKKSLFHQYLSPSGTAVLNRDDAYVRSFIGELKDRKVLTFGAVEQADVMAENLAVDADGTRFHLRCSAGGMDIHSALLGHHNVENLLAAAAVGLAEGLTLEEIKAGLESVRAVPGRLEPVDCGQNFKVLVDFAHTPDALQRVLTLLRQLPHRRLLTVFGCGGERDRLKRPLMGKITCELSDQVFVTSDNPRGEDPLAILKDIEGGMKGYESKYQIIPDRREAIISAIRSAGESDLVLLAGKGHETTQTWADRTTAFDDRKVAQSALRNLKS